MAQYASVGPGGSFPPTGAVADWVRLLALPCAKASPVKRTPQKPPTRPIKLKVPSHPVLYPAAFRQRRFAAPSLREEFGGTFGHKATTNEQFARWGQDTRPAAGGETAPAENSPAGPNTIRQRLHTLRLRFATPSPAKRKNIPQKKRRASSAGRHQIGDWHTAAVTKTANPAQNSNTAKLTERGYELVQITRHRFSFILSEKYSALAIGSDKFVATLACNIAGPGGGRRKKLNGS